MISTVDEWSPLKKIIVGSATDANWPVNDPVFSKESEKTTWKETPVPRGPVPQRIIDEANEDLDLLATTLTSLGVEVVRPDPLNFQTHDGMYNYCPRDRFLVYGSTIVDAANVCRLGDKMLYLESASGNQKAYRWLCEQFPDVTIELCNFYAGVHIDSTIVPLREGLVMLNGQRVGFDTVPRVFDGWHKIWVNDVVAQDFYRYPYASKWIAMNMLVVDPHTVICDADQTELIKTLKSYQFEVIPMRLRQSRTLGGGFHCVTLDLIRSNQR